MVSVHGGDRTGDDEKSPGQGRGSAAGFSWFGLEAGTQGAALRKPPGREVTASGNSWGPGGQLPPWGRLAPSVPPTTLHQLLPLICPLHKAG